MALRRPVQTEAAFLRPAAGGPMAKKKPGPKKNKNRDRYPCGKLHPLVDHGHAWAIEHRSGGLVPVNRSEDSRAGYPLGALDMAAILADPLPPPNPLDTEEEAAKAAEKATRRAISQSRARHNAGSTYRYLHDRLWGNRSTAKSNMGNLAAAKVQLSGQRDALAQIERLSVEDVIGLTKRHNDRLRALSSVGFGGIRAIVDSIVLCENYDLPMDQLPNLRAGLAALARVRG
jgi:hypothetical protein